VALGAGLGGDIVMAAAVVLGAYEAYVHAALVVRFV
jgi:hypothetical protein